ncbi:tripartite motif-containing protein 14-like [Columba guinea]|nr:tripartite motif-containing protein 14-like [Columba guinea]
MKQEKPRSLAPRARVCGVHAGRPLEWFCENCGCCVCALCRTLGPHRRQGIHLMTHAVHHNQELMSLCLKDLEERKEQEAGNRRRIEQAANDLKVKCGFLLHYMMHAIMSKRQLSGKLVELQLLLQEEESLAKNLIDEKTWQVLEAHDQQLQSCQQKFTALGTFSCRIRKIQQHSDPVQLLEVVVYGLFLPPTLIVPGKLL